MSINRFPYQDDILREQAKGAATAAEVSNRIVSEGRAPGPHREALTQAHRASSNVDLVRQPAVIPIPEQCARQPPPAKSSQRVQHHHVTPSGDAARDEACGIHERTSLLGADH